MLAVRVRNELSKMAVAVWGHRLEAADAISAALTVKRVPVIIDVRNNILWSIQLILGGVLGMWGENVEMGSAGGCI